MEKNTLVSKLRIKISVMVIVRNSVQVVIRI